MTAKHILVWVLACIFTGVLVSGCAQEIATPGIETLGPSLTATPTDAIEGNTTSDTKVPPTEQGESVDIRPSETSTPLGLEDPLERKFVNLTREDLAKHLDVGVDRVELVSIQAVKWPDASLGCPLPNMMYAQVITPGYRIILSVVGDEYDYHTDMQGNIVLCDLSNLPILRSTPGWRSEGGN
jgi:hypothetical protein